MSVLDFIKQRLISRTDSAQVAKERLQIIVAHERRQRKTGVVNLQELQQKLIAVIAEYLRIDKDQVNVELQRDDTRSVLELNVTLPEEV
jgi:cell division topological specificity factor